MWLWRPNFGRRSQESTRTNEIGTIYVASDHVADIKGRRESVSREMNETVDATAHPTERVAPVGKIRTATSVGHA